MKIVGVLIGLLIMFSARAQKPEKVYSIVKELREAEWYEQQADLWKKEVSKRKKNADAWYNYYAAVRALRNISYGDTALTRLYGDQCKEVADAAYKAVPKTFEGNHIVWWQSGNDPEKFEYLERAYKIDPTDSRAYGDLMTHYALAFDTPNFEKYAEMVYMSCDMPGGTYNWAYNMLAGLDENAVVFTAGDNDTFLPWIVQVVKNFRKDVIVLNTSLMLLDDYRDEMFKRIGIEPYGKSRKDIKTGEEYRAFVKGIKDAVFANADNRPVYVMGTAIQQFEDDDYSERLYLTGLSYKYCDYDVDNLSIIKRNVEKRYLLDGISEEFSFHKLDNKTKQVNLFYLPAFMKLYTHYYLSEETLKGERLLKLILKIVEGSTQEEDVKEWLKQF